MERKNMDKKGQTERRKEIRNDKNKPRIQEIKDMKEKRRTEEKEKRNKEVRME